MERNTDRTSREDIKAQLEKKIRTDDGLVFERLRLHDVSDSFVEACFFNFEQANKMHIAELVGIEVESLRSFRQQEAEKHMHEPLVSPHSF